MQAHSQDSKARGDFHATVDNVGFSATIMFGAGAITIAGLLDEIGSGAAARCRSSFTTLLPMIKPFFGQWLATQNALGRLQTMQKAIQISDGAILFLGAGAEIIYANAAAEQLLAVADGLRRNGDRLACEKFADTLRLQAAIDLFRQPGSRGNEVSPVLALAREGRRPLTCALVTAQPGHSELSDLVQVIAYVFDPEEDMSSIVEPVCRLYHLSDREAKLTCALVAGLSLAEAAGKLKMQEQTARSYLKHVFSKTDTNRQAELVRLMIKSAVRIAVTGRIQAFT